MFILTALILNIKYIDLVCFRYYIVSGWGESACRSAGEMGWRWISWPGRLTNPWWSRCIWTSPDGATASASEAAAFRAEESLAKEESGSAQSIPQLLQSARGQGWRSDICKDGTALPAAGITASMSLHLHNMLIDLYCALKQLVGWLSFHIFDWLCVLRKWQWSSFSRHSPSPPLCPCCLPASPPPRQSLPTPSCTLETTYMTSYTPLSRWRLRHTQTYWTTGWDTHKQTQIRNCKLWKLKLWLRLPQKKNFSEFSEQQQSLF